MPRLSRLGDGSWPQVGARTGRLVSGLARRFIVSTVFRRASRLPSSGCSISVLTPASANAAIRSAT